MTHPLVSKVARTLGMTRQVRCDRVVSVQELLHGGAGGNILLPSLPQELLDRDENFEFAAASIIERVVLGALVRRQQPKTIFEIGTFRGVTAVTMAANAPAGSALYTLDLPPEMDADAIAREHYSDSDGRSGFHQMAKSGTQRHVGAAIEHYTGACTITQLFGDSTKYDVSEFAGKVDLFFVDGCHEHAGALADTRTAWKCLAPGGLIVWHDYTWASVQQAVSDAALGIEVSHVSGTSIGFGTKPGA